MRAVTILVVFCPCALVLATPTAIMAAIGNATKHGFLVREGDALERLSAVRKLTFDKTGTLTYGTPQVVSAVSFTKEYGEDEIFELAAAAESRSEHPLGKAVVRSLKEQKKKDVMPADEFEMIPGRGVKSVVKGNKILAGTPELLSENGILMEEWHRREAEFYLNQGCTVIYLSKGNIPAGFLALSDTIRTEAGAVIERIKEIGSEPVLLTGDHKSAAMHIAGQLGIMEIHAECLPEDKLNWVNAYEEEKKRVCMIGDGINDAPALKRAFVGIAMGGIGSDIAVEAADIALVSDDIKEIPHLLALSKKMMSTIHYNLFFSMFLNFTAIILAVTGILNPVVGALVHNAGSLAVIINSAFLLKWSTK